MGGLSRGKSVNRSPTETSGDDLGGESGGSSEIENCELSFADAVNCARESGGVRIVGILGESARDESAGMAEADEKVEWIL